MNNPKLAGSNIIDCIPQTGECPVKCAECFYNGGRFYRPLREPLIPTDEEAAGKIVRVNSGHDSNLQREYVLKATAHYPNRFYNTSIPRFDFPAPVVFTCNGPRLFLVPVPANVMFVRVRVCSWNLDEVDRAVEFYRVGQRKQVVLTFMRYYTHKAVPKPLQPDYEWRKSVLNYYWCPRPETIVRILARYKGRGVRMCGTPGSSLCVDCRNCELLYWLAKGCWPCKGCGGKDEGNVSRLWPDGQGTDSLRCDSVVHEAIPGRNQGLEPTSQGPVGMFNVWRKGENMTTPASKIENLKEWDAIREIASAMSNSENQPPQFRQCDAKYLIEKLLLGVKGD